MDEGVDLAGCGDAWTTFWTALQAMTPDDIDRDHIHDLQRRCAAMDARLCAVERQSQVLVEHARMRRDMRLTSCTDVARDEFLLLILITRVLSNPKIV
jgi:hypothetical protein